MGLQILEIVLVILCVVGAGLFFGISHKRQVTELVRLRQLAAACYAGLGAEHNLPEKWLDVLDAAANGKTFEVDGLLPYYNINSTIAEQDVLNERARQIYEEGYDAVNDDELRKYQLSRAAACYALNTVDVINSSGKRYWHPDWIFKTAGRRRQLVKAGALIIAEIERLDRMGQT